MLDVFSDSVLICCRVVVVYSRERRKLSAARLQLSLRAFLCYRYSGRSKHWHISESGIDDFYNFFFFSKEIIE